MKHLTTHHTNALNKQLRLARYESGNFYAVDWPGAESSPVLLKFHTGNPDFPKGISNEVLLAILIDRFETHQASETTCTENEEAHRHLALALQWLGNRTDRRQREGVEGTQTPEPAKPKRSMWAPVQPKSEPEQVNEYQIEQLHHKLIEHGFSPDSITVLPHTNGQAKIQWKHNNGTQFVTIDPQRITKAIDLNAGSPELVWREIYKASSSGLVIGEPRTYGPTDETEDQQQPEQPAQLNAQPLTNQQKWERVKGQSQGMPRLDPEQTKRMREHLDALPKGEFKTPVILDEQPPEQSKADRETTDLKMPTDATKKQCNICEQVKNVSDLHEYKGSYFCKPEECVHVKKCHHCGESGRLFDEIDFDCVNGIYFCEDGCQGDDEEDGVLLSEEERQAVIEKASLGDVIPLDGKLTKAQGEKFIKHLIEGAESHQDRMERLNDPATDPNELLRQLKEELEQRGCDLSETIFEQFDSTNLDRIKIRFLLAGETRTTTIQQARQDIRTVPTDVNNWSVAWDILFQGSSTLDPQPLIEKLKHELTIRGCRLLKFQVTPDQRKSYWAEVANGYDTKEMDLQQAILRVQQVPAKDSLTTARQAWSALFLKNEYAVDQTPLEGDTQ